MKIRKYGSTAALAIFALAGSCDSASAGCDESPAPPVRLAYNYCTLSYTFAYYSEAEWEAEAARLAKAGYNAALVTDGTFKVWELTLRELGFEEKDIFAFIPDECARAWWLMGNLEGEGGPLDRATVDADGERGRFVCAKMREKGVEPVLQGFFGMVPTWLSERDKSLETVPQGKWGPYERPAILDPAGEAFARFAAAWYGNLEKVYGIKPKYLAGDLFHEGGKTGGIDVTAAVRAVQSAQQSAFPGVTWVVQAWQNNPVPAVRAGLDPRHTLIESLVYDMSAFADDGSVCQVEYGELPWIWCEVLNFGGNHGLYGNLKTFARMGRAAKGKGAKTFRGYGSLSEGFFTNPVCSDLFEDMMTRPAGSEMTDAELAAWLDAWVERRYGTDDARLKRAWKILAETAYACPRRQEGTVENLICANPAWNVESASTWGPKQGWWFDTAEQEKALGLMSAAAPAAKTAAFERDLYDLKRQVRANRFRTLLPELKDGGAASRKDCESLFDSICAEPLSGVPAEFRLAAWEERARTRAGERGAAAWRRMVTGWSDPRYGRTSVADYANREYAELMRDFYIPRWREFFRRERAEMQTKDKREDQT